MAEWIKSVIVNSSGEDECALTAELVKAGGLLTPGILETE